MKILKVKQVKDNFLVNDLFSVPNDPSNSDRQAIQKWVFEGGIVEPEFTTLEEIDNLRQSLIPSRIKYLLDTDFRVLRFIDEGTDYPGEIKTKRIQARKEINAIQAGTTFAKINLFTVDFK